MKKSSSKPPKSKNTPKIPPQPPPNQPDPPPSGPRPIDPNDPDPIVRTPDGRPRDCYANIVVALTLTREWRGVLGYNEFSRDVVLLKRPPCEHEEAPANAKWIQRIWRDTDDSHTLSWLNQHGQNPSIDHVARAVKDVAGRNSFHPVRDYLKSLKWDKVPRIHAWLSTYLGTVDREYTQVIGPRWLISAVARVFQPGCKADCALVLIGKQGIRKSTSLEVLAGREWFTDQMPKLDSKDASIQLAGKWIIEFGEMGSMEGVGTAHIKNFLSRNSDRYRPPHAKWAINVDRQCVFAGTNNHFVFNKDETGARRYWSVECSQIDIEKLAKDRDQLWAEAVYQYKKGHVWCLDTPYLMELAEAEQTVRYESDSWEESIQSWLKNRTFATINDVLVDCLGLSPAMHGQKEQTRVARCLRTLKWLRRQDRIDGERVWRYHPEDPK